MYTFKLIDRKDILDSCKKHLIIPNLKLKMLNYDQLCKYILILHQYIFVKFSDSTKINGGYITVEINDVLQKCRSSYVDQDDVYELIKARDYIVTGWYAKSTVEEVNKLKESFVIEDLREDLELIQ